MAKGGEVSILRTFVKHKKLLQKRNNKDRHLHRQTFNMIITAETMPLSVSTKFKNIPSCLTKLVFTAEILFIVNYLLFCPAATEAKILARPGCIYISLHIVCGSAAVALLSDPRETSPPSEVHRRTSAPGDPSAALCGRRWIAGCGRSQTAPSARRQ